MDRRDFMKRSACLSATGAFACASNSAAATPNSQTTKPLFVATWPFGRFACEEAVRIASKGSMLDAIEKGIWVTESDIKNVSVGIGGIPNAEGNVELDACIMSGPNHQAGAVAGLQDILHPISVARQVMEETPHVMLVGEGARKFALEKGHQAVNLLSDKQKANWERWKKEQQKPEINEDHHDTIAMLGIDAQGDLYGGCSTSGWGFKIPGRVGDSPIIGSGLYVDNTVGAAGATGLGENVMRHCGSFLVVEMMRQGASPTEACEQAIKRIEALECLPASPKKVVFNGQVEMGVAAENMCDCSGNSLSSDFSVSSCRALEIRPARGKSAGLKFSTLVNKAKRTITRKTHGIPVLKTCC